MSEVEPQEYELARQAHDDLAKLGEICVAFAGVERLTQYGPDRSENDSEHSFHLAISATELAATYYPELDAGLVAQFSLVHDLPEVHVGDTPSYILTAEERIMKQEIEMEAVEILLKELPPHSAQLLRRYEEQLEPEARFVRYVDKIMPAIIHMVVTDANRDVFLKKYGISSIEELEASSFRRAAELAKMFPEFEFIRLVRQLTSATSRQKFFPGE